MAKNEKVRAGDGPEMRWFLALNEEGDPIEVVLEVVGNQGERMARSYRRPAISGAEVFNRLGRSVSEAEAQRALGLSDDDLISLRNRTRPSYA